MSMNANRLGDAIKAAEDSVRDQYIDENSDPADAEAYRTARARALAQAIIDEINDNATIESLSCDQTLAGQVPHIHSVATNELTGKIK